MRILTYLFGTKPETESEENKAQKVKETKELIHRSSKMLGVSEEEIWLMIRPMLVEDDLPYTYAELMEYV
jgi:hypothetical protein